MRQHLRMGLLLGGLLLPAPAAAFVVEAPGVELQQIMAYKQEFAKFLEMVKQTEHQVTQLQRQVTQIQHAYTTVQHGVKNLAKLDLNSADDLRNLHRQLSGKMRRIDNIGYTSERAWKKAEQVYAKSTGLLTAAQQKAAALAWAQAERDAAQVAIETQAILDNQEVYERRWHDILKAAHAAEGNLQVQQAAVQAQGVLGTQMQEVTQVLATQARQESMQVLKEAKKAEMEQTALEHITTEIETTYQSAGRRLHLTRTGRE